MKRGPINDRFDDDIDTGPLARRDRIAQSDRAEDEVRRRWQDERDREQQPVQTEEER